MKPVAVTVRKVNNEVDKQQHGLELAAKYTRLAAQGLQGKHLIHELLTDDWDADPVTVTLSWAGKRIVIPYD